VKKISLMIQISFLLIMFSGCALFDARDISKNKANKTESDINKKVDLLISKMTIDEKIGQMVQAERNAISPEDVKNFKIGSILSGGGSVPENNNYRGWIEMYNDYQKEALKTRLGIPMIYGIDAVHGHNNFKNATVFPHNIGIGAIAVGALEKNDVEEAKKLIEEIGRITAKEVALTGIDWTFAPCVAVVQDIRWGRTYESFGENPELQKIITPSYIKGLQGENAKMDGERIVATAKHFVGDGGTSWGTGEEDPLDKGDTIISEKELREIHLKGFEEAIASNVGSIMVSFNSWQGTKIHGSKYLVTDLLKEELGFDGVVVSDWEGIHGIEAETYHEQVVKSVNAGIDMFMEPSEWKYFIGELQFAVKNNEVEIERIDDAVKRILTLKYKANLFEEPMAKIKDSYEIGKEEHRNTAKEAVKKSLVLLKNENDILPLSGNKNIYVAGSNSDNIGNQCGGWTISWQGAGGNTTKGTTIKAGIEKMIENEDGKMVSDMREAEVAIIVLGEKPYAEGNGDSENLDLLNGDKAIIKEAKELGIPTIVIMISGRPMIITDYINDWDAFVAGWLPGTEGEGIAEILFGKENFYGRLPFTWPLKKENVVESKENSNLALFKYGEGLEMDLEK